MSGTDPFRPRSEPHRSLYDAFQVEAGRRQGRTYEQWCDAETRAVHAEAERVAPVHGLRAPTREEVVRARTRAEGHIDYGLTWVCEVVRSMSGQPAANKGY